MCGGVGWGGVVVVVVVVAVVVVVVWAHAVRERGGRGCAVVVAVVVWL